MTNLLKRRWLQAAALTAISAAVLVGCGKKEEAKPVEAPAAAKPEPLKIAFAYVGPVGDGGWTFAHDNARKALEKEFGDKISTSFVENVPEFVEWGRLTSAGKPIAAEKGSIFNAWIATLRALGYSVEWRILCAADYGDPTTRRRLFVQAVRGRRKIIWPEPTHAPSGDLFGRPRWRSAEEIID